MKVCEAIADWCQEIDTPFVAGIPGNGILEIIDKLSTNTEVPFILTRHEQGAAMMAYSYAFRAGKPAVVVGSKAPGATNLAIGVMGAFVESLPMIVITAQVSNAHERYEAFEEIDLAAFFQSITKWSVQVNNPDRVIEILNEAYRRSMTGRPGPVHVAIPYNFMQHEIEGFASPTIPRQPTFDEATASEVVGELASAKRPIIIAGGGVPAGNADDLLSIAHSLNVPVVQSWLRKPIPDRDICCIGMAGIGGSPAAQYAIAEADVVLALGCRFGEQMTEHYKMRFNSDVKLIHVDIDAAVIGRVYPVHMGVVADLRDVLPALRTGVLKGGTTAGGATTDLAAANHGSWARDLQSRQRAYLNELGSHSDHDLLEPTGRYVVEKMRELLDQQSHLVLDSGNYLHWAEQYFPVERAGLFHYPTSGTMGFGVPGAIGAKIAHPNDLVCALVGDGGFAMTMSELETASRIGTPILVVIINNSTLGHIRMRQEVNFGGRIVGVNFSEQDFSAVPRAFGVHGVSVRRTADVGPALVEAIAKVRGGESAVVDVHVTDLMAAGPLAPWWPSS